MKRSFSILLLMFLAVSVWSVNNCLEFNGIDGYVTTADSPEFSVSQFTIEMWFYWDDANDFDEDNIDFLCSKALENLEIHTTTGFGLRFIPATAVYLDTPTGVFNPQEWTHIAFYYDPGSSSAGCYINGVETILTNNGPNPLSSPILDTAEQFNLGRRLAGGVYWYDGKIDDFRFWNDVRTQTEIQNNKNLELNGSEEGLVLYYKLNEDVGVTAINSQGNNLLDGTLQGGCTWTASDVTLPVELSSFTAIQTNDGNVQVSWQTQSETDLAGYNIYRHFEIDSANSTKLNQDLILGENDSNGASYNYLDENEVDYATAYYWLESVDLDGTVELFGPVSVNFEQEYLSLANFTAVTPNHQNVELEWTTEDVSDDVVYYDIYRSTDNNFELAEKLNSANIFIEDGNLNNYRFVDENTEVGNEYYYWLTANNYDGILSLLNPIRIKLNHTEIAELSATINSAEVSITWQSTFEVEMDSYKIYKSTTNFYNDAIEIYNTSAQNELNGSVYSFIDEEAKQGEVLYYWVKGVSNDRTDYLSNGIRVEVPYLNLLHGNYPNPFNPTTTIKYSVNENTEVELAIYNLKGQKVKTFVNSFVDKGEYSLKWNGSNDEGKPVSSGVYFLRMKTPNKVSTQKLMLLK